jgi:hypothetical protein
MASSLDNGMIAFFTAIYSDQAHGGNWKEEVNPRTQVIEMVKDLAASRFGLVQRQKELNEFLIQNDLPMARFIEQEGYEGSMDCYLILVLNKSIWEKKILPIYKNFEATLEAFKKSQSAAKPSVA